MKKFVPLFLFAALIFLPKSAYAGLSEGCFPVVQCNSGEDFYADACQAHIETLTGAGDTCEALFGAPAAGKSWAFSCDAGCYQKGGGGGTVNPCPGGVMVSGNCLITLDVVDDDVPVTGTAGYKIWDGADLTFLAHVNTAGCTDDQVAVWDSASPTKWSCADQSDLWATDGTNVWRNSNSVGIQTPTPGAALDINNSVGPSILAGSLATATGTRSASFGDYTSATNENAFAQGKNTTASGVASVAMNAYGTASGAGAAAFNNGTTAAGYYSSAFGLGTVAWNPYSMAVGRYNDTSKPVYNNNYFNSNPEDLLFMVGVGADDANRENGLVVTSSGRVGIGTNGPKAGLHLKGPHWPESFIYLDTDATSQDAGLRYLVNGTTKWHMYNSDVSNSDALEIRNQAFDPVMVFEQSTGDVGVGTASPTAPLHVVGPGNVNSSFGGATIGVVASGDGGGGLLGDANSSGLVAIANDDIGITALGDAYAGYFGDSNSSGYAYLGYGDIGVLGLGNYSGGYFNDLDNADTDTYLSWGGYSMLADGPINIAESGTPALYVSNKEALWFDGSTYSWGYGGTRNVFDDQVVVGTTSPISSYDLEVAGSELVYGQGYFNGDVYVNNSTWPGNGYLQVKGGGGYGAYLQLYENYGVNNYGWDFKNDGAADKLYIITRYPGNSSIDGKIRWTMDYYGNVGIGTTAPSAKMHANGGSYAIKGTNATGAGGYFTSTGGSYVYAASGVTGLTANGSFAGGIFTDSNGSYGYVGYGSYSFYGNGIVRGGSAYVNGSDARLKKNVKTIDGALDKVLALRGVEFEWKDDTFNQGKKLGFIAQEVEKVVPELVVPPTSDQADEDVNEHNPDSYYGMEYGSVTALLVESVKELEAENESLKDVVCELKPEAELCR